MYGGSGDDFVNAISFNAGELLLVGSTLSPTIAGFDASLDGNQCGVVVHVSLGVAFWNLLMLDRYDECICCGFVLRFSRLICKCY